MTSSSCLLLRLMVIGLTAGGNPSFWYVRSQPLFDLHTNTQLFNVYCQVHIKNDSSQLWYLDTSKLWTLMLFHDVRTAKSCLDIVDYDNGEGPAKIRRISSQQLQDQDDAVFEDLSNRPQAHLWPNVPYDLQSCGFVKVYPTVTVHVTLTSSEVNDSCDTCCWTTCSGQPSGALRVDNWTLVAVAVGQDNQTVQTRMFGPVADANRTRSLDWIEPDDPGSGQRSTGGDGGGDPLDRLRTALRHRVLSLVSRCDYAEGRLPCEYDYEQQCRQTVTRSPFRYRGNGDPLAAMCVRYHEKRDRCPEHLCQQRCVSPDMYWTKCSRTCGPEYRQLLYVNSSGFETCPDYITPRVEQCQLPECVAQAKWLVMLVSLCLALAIFYVYRTLVHIFQYLNELNYVYSCTVTQSSNPSENQTPPTTANQFPK